MEYSPIHNKLIVSPSDIQQFSVDLLYAMVDIRKAFNLPLTPRKKDGGLDRIDYIERSILSACKNIGIDFGADWGHNLDLSKYGE